MSPLGSMIIIFVEIFNMDGEIAKLHYTAITIDIYVVFAIYFIL